MRLAISCSTFSRSDDARPQVVQLSKDPKPQAFSRAVPGRGHGGGAQPIGDLWRERFVSAGAIEPDGLRMRLEVEATGAATDIAA